MKTLSLSALCLLFVAISPPAHAYWSCDCAEVGDGGQGRGETRAEAVRECGGKVRSCQERLEADDPVCLKHPDLDVCER